MRPNSLHAADIAHFVHQQTDLADHHAHGAVLMARGEGVRVWDTEGREYIEAMAGLWCASLGFSEKRLADAADQLLLRRLAALVVVVPDQLYRRVIRLAA